MKKIRSENGDDTKQNKRRQSSWDPNSVGLVLGYFERAKLSHSLIKLKKSLIKRKSLNGGDTKRNEDDTKRCMRLAVGPNSVSLGSGKFKRVKLFLSLIRTNLH
ncbi:hypothetical protein T05_318, partial [Trichinella murrelli]